jgi:Negative regulator of sigma F
MTERSLSAPPDALRAAIAADLSRVQPLRLPLVRALALTPLALLLLVAAPAVFDLRDVRALGGLWSWGASVVQVVAGLALAAAALSEAVPGRAWSPRALAAILVASLFLFVAVTLGTWQASPVPVAGARWAIGLVCLVASAVTALPAVALTSVLVVRAFALRPGIAGLLAGLGGGLMADAGWRLFCHFSEPTHVLAAHLGGVFVAAALGTCLTGWLARR